MIESGKVARIREIIVAAATLLAPATASAQGAEAPDAYMGKSRLFVLTDIGNEPDDQMSLVRLLTYSNEIDIEAMTAVTSTWLRKTTNPGTLRSIIRSYAEVRPKLAKHASGWPRAEELEQRVYSGPTAYGIAAINAVSPSSGAKALVIAADRPDPRPLWVSIWGGANTLAEALEFVRKGRPPEQLAAFVAKLRVYSISDQDDAGPWIRREFPRLFYIVSPSFPNNEDYASATWTGISGDEFYANGAGADGTKVTNAWLDQNIRKGPLGARYPRYEFIMEGDTPAFLGLTQNGLNSALSPAWGGWGGRYVYRRPYGEMGRIWTQGGALIYGVNSRDSVTGADGLPHRSDQATIWRWRDAYQRDFAARIAWTIKSRDAANHHPVVVVNGDGGKAPMQVEVPVGEPVVLDASGSHDPDRGQHLHYRWFHYAEAGASLATHLTDVVIEGSDTAQAIVTAAKACRPPWPDAPLTCRSGAAHVILEVTDDGTPQLTSYRRVIVRALAKP